MDLDAAVEAARGGDRDAVGALYDALSAPLLAFLRTSAPTHQDAEDLLGETFIAAIRDLSTFEGDFAAFKGWIYRIASNRSIDHARWRRRRPSVPLEEADPGPAPDDPEAEALTATEQARVWEAIRALPDLQRRVVSLRLAAGLNTAEIAEVLGKRANAVKALQHRALRGLARRLRAYPDAAEGRLGGERNDADEPSAP